MHGSGWAFMNYHIALIKPTGYPHSECFREVAEGLLWGLQSLGHTATLGENTIDAVAINIVLGGHLLTEEEARMLFPSTILYNLEQLGSAALPPWYLGLASRLRVWDYSRLNLEKWRQLPCLLPLLLVEVGFAPGLRRIAPAPQQDIDVLFYGSMNDRRSAILQRLQAAGLSTHHVFGVYGSERDGLIARAKVVLNVHFYEAAVFEVVRVSYLLANGKAVVCEQSPDLGDLADAVAACPYEELVERCIGLVADDGARRVLEARAVAIFARRGQVEILRKALAGGAASFPRTLNLGSGKDWREDCLNIDINDYWKPDAVLDISQPLAPCFDLDTERFGSIRIEPGCFDAVLANDVLEHIPNLVRAMTTVLQLLRPGGLFHIQVPYDLSLGGWQDPTHVRAFNENSWLYYTDWFWYLGWRESRFHLDRLEFVLSAVGERLKGACEREDLVRSPRAVDSMRLTMSKRPLDAAEKETVANYLKRPQRAMKASVSMAPRDADQVDRPVEIPVPPGMPGEMKTSAPARVTAEVQAVRLRADPMREVAQGDYDGLNEKLYAAIPTARRVLEFGCGRGTLGEKYKQAHPGAFWAGVDSHAQALAVAGERLDATYQLNVDDGLADGFGEKFDCVVFSDLLEHLKQPEEFLARLRAFTTPDATLVCCVPNMGHISVLERMLMGDLCCDREGLLDGTHLRLFSQRSLFKLLLDAGWLPDLQDEDTADHADRGLISRLIEVAGEMGVPQAAAARHLFTYRMIVRCSKNADREAADAAGGLFSVIVPVTNEAQLKLNVLRSPGLQEVNAEVILVRNAASAAEAFAAGARHASSPWRLFCHQDVYFPRGAGRATQSLLAGMSGDDPASHLIGFAGLGVDGKRAGCAGLLVDRTKLFDFPGTSQAISIDEFCVALHRDVEYSIDASLGWHLWGTDLCLQAIHRKAGARFARIVRVPLFHNSTNGGDLSAAYRRSEVNLLSKYPHLSEIISLNSTAKRIRVPGVAPAAADAHANALAKLRKSYLDMVQRCVIGTVYEDPNQDRWSPHTYDPNLREQGLDWPSQAHSMIGKKRMTNLRLLAERVMRDDVPGDFIETGVWRGGACIVMRAVLEAYGDKSRRVWVADSFAGLPVPKAGLAADNGDPHHTYEELSVSADQVRANFAKYDLLDDQVCLLEGWFSETLAAAPIERLALLRLDGDMFESTMDAITALYDKVSPGGYIIVDDYIAVPGCRKAIDEFRVTRGIAAPLHDIDGMGVFWQKQANSPAVQPERAGQLSAAGA
jgi:2-polyprenyl-3-methyl-5-hydroxy-6-metoxy-1,4-benzoquinol methylase